MRCKLQEKLHRVREPYSIVMDFYIVTNYGLRYKCTGVCWMCINLLIALLSGLLLCWGMSFL